MRLGEEQEALDAPEGDAGLVEGLGRAREDVELLDEDVAQPEHGVGLLDLQASSAVGAVERVARDEDKEGGDARSEEDERLHGGLQSEAAPEQLSLGGAQRVHARAERLLPRIHLAKA